MRWPAATSWRKSARAWISVTASMAAANRPLRRRHSRDSGSPRTALIGTRWRSRRSNRQSLGLVRNRAGVDRGRVCPQLIIVMRRVDAVHAAVFGFVSGLARYFEIAVWPDVQHAAARTVGLHRREDVGVGGQVGAAVPVAVDAPRFGPVKLDDSVAVLDR